MIEVNTSLINGCMVGIEHIGSLSEDMDWAIGIDLLFVRIVLVKWNRED